MAIKIQGTTIIDDSKNIYTVTGFYSDSVNSAIRPKSSSGASYLQRWTGSTWDTIFVTSDTGITCNRSVSVANGYYYYGDGRFLTNLPTPAFPYNYYYDANNTAVRAAGTTFIQNSNGSETWASFASNSVVFTQNTGVSGTLTVNGNSCIGPSCAINLGYDGSQSFIEIRRGTYAYLDFGAELYSDYAARVAGTNGGDLILDSRSDVIFARVVEGASTADPNLKLTAGGRIRRLTSTKRIKENIQYSDFENICDKIYDLKTAYFTYKEAENPNVIDMGLIAEDVNEVIPELTIIDYFKDQYEEVIDKERGNSVVRKLIEGAVKTPVSVNYDRIPIIMIGTLKKLRQRVIDLEEEVKRLKESLETP